MKYIRQPRQALSLLLLAMCLYGILSGTAAAQSKQNESAPDTAAPALLLLHKKYSRAEALLRQLIPKHKDQVELQVMLAYALFRENKPAESLKEYTLAARHRHPTAEDLKWVALDYVLLNDYLDAEKWMYQSLRMNPKDESAWYDMGRILYTRNQFKKALICFQQALKLKPHSVDAENNLGLTYEALYKWDDAIAAYKSAIAWQDTSKVPSAEPLLNLGIVYLHRNHLAEALPLLTQAIAIAPHNKRVLTQLARANYLLGRYADAESELRTALHLSPKDAALHFQLGRVLSKEGKNAEAKAEFAKVGALDGTHSDNP